MQQSSVKAAAVLGVFIFLGLTALGYLAGSSAIRFKEYERTVTVKGLAEKEVPADIALWPIQYTQAGNDLAALYDSLDRDTGTILKFLESRGFGPPEITVAPPAITDKLAQQYGNGSHIELRYTAVQTVSVYSPKVDGVRDAISKLAGLGKQGIVFSGGSYQGQTEYIYTRLNRIKPEMVEEATRKAREVAEKFAQDSSSRLGKIKRAQQGQFSIADRDKNTPYIKKVRVVSTVEYYLSD